MEQLTARQIAEWEEFNRTEPIGQYKHDYELAYLMSHLANLFIGAFGKKGAQLTKPEDYLLQWGEQQEVKKQSVSEMRNLLMTWANSRSNEKKVKNFRR